MLFARFQSVQVSATSDQTGWHASGVPTYQFSQYCPLDVGGVGRILALCRVAGAWMLSAIVGKIGGRTVDPLRSPPLAVLCEAER